MARPFVALLAGTLLLVAGCGSDSSRVAGSGDGSTFSCTNGDKYNEKPASCPSGGPPCAMSTATIGKELHGTVSSKVDAEPIEKGGPGQELFWYCYYKVSGISTEPISLRVGVIYCDDPSPIAAENGSGYNPETRRAVAVRGSVLSRADIEDDPQPAGLEAGVAAVAASALETFAPRLAGKPSGPCA